MRPENVVAELMEMRRKVVREMPHIDCECMSFTDSRKCYCYKHDVIGVLLDAEREVRTALGMKPF